MTYPQSFNFKNFYIWLPKSDISLVKIRQTFLEIFSQNPRKLSIFPIVAFWWRHKINLTWRYQKFLPLCNDFYPLYILTKFHRHLTWNSQVRKGGHFCPPPPLSLFRLAKKPSPNRIKTPFLAFFYLESFQTDYEIISQFCLLPFYNSCDQHLIKKE